MDTIFVAFPFYGQSVNIRSLWQCIMLPVNELSDQRFRHFNAKVGSSLLAHTFNVLYARALDARDDPKIGVTHFVMLHSDVEPENFWLEKLYAEYLRLNSPDLLSVVMPIKDDHGVTSTAIGHPEDPWSLRGRITMHELVKLPQAFTAADLGHPDAPLLVNTGLMIFDLRRPWCDEVHFTIQDRIVQTPEGRRAEVIPEDWNLSRQLWHRGGTVYATRAIKAHHHGDYGFPNHIGWGDWKSDRLDLYERISGTDTAAEDVAISV